MDVATITTLISSLGFPIVVAIYMIKINQKQADQHASEIKVMTEAINELKLAIVTLTERFNQ